MIIENGASFSFHHAGLFNTDKEWIHPEIIQPTHELIYVVKGNVCICANGNHYNLKKGAMVLMKANTAHRGFKASDGSPSFYWVHFTSDNVDAIGLPEYLEFFDEGALFKELLHYHCRPHTDKLMTDAILAHIFAKMISVSNNEYTSKIANEILEWTRINANAELNIAAVAAHFGYTAEHISRIIKSNFNTGLKTLINNFIIKSANDLLCNSNYTITEIGNILHFYDYNAFTKFYKYHQGMSPKRYRNKYSNTYMNNQ